MGVIILGGIMLGVFTATEAAAVGRHLWVLSVRHILPGNTHHPVTGHFMEVRP